MCLKLIAKLIAKLIGSILQHRRKHTLRCGTMSTDMSLSCCIHPSRHHEIRLSLSQLCGVKKKAPLQLLSPGQCAPHSFGVESPSSHQRHSIEAWLHRGAAIMPPTASRWRPAMVSRWLRLVRLWNSATAACGRQPSACRPMRFTSCSRRTRPLSPLHSCAFRSRVRQHGVSVGLRRR